MGRCDAGELVANESEDDVLPDAICDALAESQDPLSTGEVKGVLPYWTTDTLMEEEVVCRGEESRWWMEVRPEGPEGLYRGKGGYLLDALFVVRNFISWRALLAEPEHPPMCRAVITTLLHAGLGRLTYEGGTYVRATEGMYRQRGEPRRRCRGAFFSHGGALLLIREGCREVF